MLAAPSGAFQPSSRSEGRTEGFSLGAAIFSRSSLAVGGATGSATTGGATGSAATGAATTGFAPISDEVATGAAAAGAGSFCRPSAFFTAFMAFLTGLPLNSGKPVTGLIVPEPPMRLSATTDSGDRNAKSSSPPRPCAAIISTACMISSSDNLPPDFSSPTMRSTAASSSAPSTSSNIARADLLSLTSPPSAINRLLIDIEPKLKRSGSLTTSIATARLAAESCARLPAACW